MKTSRFRLSMATACLAFVATAHAGTLSSLRDAARQTVMSNPEVLSAFHEFRAAEQQTRVARGGYLPRLDLEAAVGTQRIDDPRFDDYDFNRDRVSVLLSQMIYDGFETRNRVRSYDFTARARYFEVLAASEQLSAEVARAYYDVLRDLFIETNPIPVKTAVNLMGLPGGDWRLPLCEMSLATLSLFNMCPKTVYLLRVQVHTLELRVADQAARRGSACVRDLPFSRPACR